MIASPPALLGGTPAVSGDHERLFHWPIVTEEDEAAILDVLRRGVMSGTDVTIQFEQEFAAWQGRTYALAHLLNVGAQLLGQVGQLVHEGDAGGQHGIGGIFGR